MPSVERVPATQSVKFNPATKKYSKPAGNFTWDAAYPNLAYEGFSGIELLFARHAMRLLMGKDTLVLSQLSKNGAMERWFGIQENQVQNVRNNLTRMSDALRHHRITLVYRPVLIETTYYEDDDGRNIKDTGDQTARVWLHEAGSGYRIHLNRRSVDYDDLDGFGRVVYHELTHKHLRTKDESNDKNEVCYGIDLAQMLALKQPDKALTNADNYALYVQSIGLHASDLRHGRSRSESLQYLRDLEEAARTPLPVYLPSFEVALQNELKLLMVTSCDDPEYKAAVKRAKEKCDGSTIPEWFRID